MDLVKATAQYQSLIDNINRKYERKLNKIDELVKLKDNAPQIFNDRTPQFIDEQIEKALDKIDKLQKDIEEWLVKELAKADLWFEKVKKDIEDELDMRISNKIKNIKGFIED